MRIPRGHLQEMAPLALPEARMTDDHVKRI